MKNNFKLKLLLSLISEVNDLAKSLQDSYKDEYRKELIKKIQANRDNNKQLDWRRCRKMPTLFFIGFSG